MSLTGGKKRKVNKSLKAWVTFVKKVQKEEKLSYKDAIHRAKVRKDKGEKWMVGGEMTPSDSMLEVETVAEVVSEETPSMSDVVTTTEQSSSMSEDGELGPMPDENPMLERSMDNMASMGGMRRKSMRRGRGQQQQRR